MGAFSVSFTKILQKQKPKKQIITKNDRKHIFSVPDTKKAASSASEADPQSFF